MNYSAYLIFHHKSFYFTDIDVDSKRRPKFKSISGRSSSKPYHDRLCDIEIEKKKQFMNFAKEKHSYEMELIQQKVDLKKLEIMRKKTGTVNITG